MTIIRCELGDHLWDRPSQRGRPPRNCPSHQPEKHEIKILTNSSVKKSIEDSIPEIKNYESSLENMIPGISEFLAQDKMETLICEVGDHEWQRESRRGKKPKRCPDHLQIISKSLPAQSTARTQDLIAEILSSPRAAHCHCGLMPEMSPAEIRALEGGCSMPWHVCNVLDDVRRKLNL